MTERAARSRRSRGHRTVTSTVAAATVGVTGLTLSWAAGAAPSSTGPNAVAAALVSRQIAADQAAIDRLRQSILATQRQLAVAGSSTATPGTAGAAATGSATPGTTPSTPTGSATTGSGRSRPRPTQPRATRSRWA